MAKFSKNDDSLVVIIGSGAGGGVLGMELAMKGIKTVVLEAGGRHGPQDFVNDEWSSCLLYTSPSPRDVEESRMPSSA